MGIKKSVFLRRQSHRFILKMSQGKTRWSPIINQTIATAIFLFIESLPKLSQKDWKMILEAYSWDSEPLTLMPYAIASDMMKKIQSVDINDHPDPKLIQRISRMAQSEQYAILTFVQLYHAGEWAGVEGLEWKDIEDRVKTSVIPE